MPSLRKGCFWLGNALVVALFEYDTPKFVHIKSKKVGVLNRLVQLAILGYVIGYGIVWQNGAQVTESVQSVVTTKLKGAALVENSSDFAINCTSNLTMLDHTDLLVPPHEPNSFFVTTNMWVTCKQSISTCGEDITVHNANCSSDDDCEPNITLRSGNGITTGECNRTTNSCIIRAWCPVENEVDSITAQGPKIDTKNFTVLVKNSISFPQLDSSYHVRNIPRGVSHDFLTDCTFDPHTSKGLLCPIFSLKQIVDMVDDKEGYYDFIATHGAVIGLSIRWSCNLDISASRCKPQYTARRLDNPTSQLSPGFNFRYPKYYYEGESETQYRDLWKAYGIWFVIEVSGQGRKFDFTRLILALGSTIALLAVATVVTDTVSLYLLKKGPFYRKKKYQQVEDTTKTSDIQDQDLDDNQSETDSVKQPIFRENPTYGK